MTWHGTGSSGHGQWRELMAVKVARLLGKDPAIVTERLKTEVAMYEGPLSPLQGSVVPRLFAAGTFKVLRPGLI